MLFVDFYTNTSPPFLPDIVDTPEDGENDDKAKALKRRPKEETVALPPRTATWKDITDALSADPAWDSGS